MNSSTALPTPTDMITHLNRFVRGQERAKQDLAVAVYNHALSQAYRRRTGTDFGKQHLLLIGPTGVGKTLLVRTLADYLGWPVGFASAAGLVEAGYKGNSVETLISSLLDQAGGNPRKAERGLIFIDEIDKIRRGETGGRDVSGEGVQNALLTLLDGRLSSGLEGQNHAAVDTSRLLFICTGAFVGLRELIEARIGHGRGRIGFVPRATEDTAAIPDLPVFSALCQVQAADLVQFGMIPEFVGRFAAISPLHELSQSDLRGIIRGDVERSPLQQQRELARLHGIQLDLTDDALDALAAEAAAIGTGARGLQRLMCRAVDAVDHRWAELASAGVTRVVIDRECAFNAGPPRLLSEGGLWPRLDLELRIEAMQDLPASPRPVVAPVVPPARPGISDTRDWSDEQCWNRIEHLKATQLAWQSTTNGARTWWQKFEAENRHRPALILRVVEELQVRQATITQFFLASLKSATDNIQANLHYLDYLMLKQQTDPPGPAPDQPQPGTAK
jgi:ATP-dependent Clp protease ATP-binding subunit ClpX